MRLPGERPGHVVALIASGCPGALAAQVDECVYALLPLADGGGAGDERVHRLTERLRAHGALGVSGVQRDPARLRQALEEAEFMLDVAGLADAPAGDGAAVSGTYRLLLRLLASHPDEVNALYEATVSPLVRYDEHHRTDLVETLATYLAVNGNMNATAARIYAHRHTIAYRLDRIHELTGLDPSMSEHRERLGLGLKAFRLLARERRG
jgi:DNA-binding PucR family transcriptional regulator